MESVTARRNSHCVIRNRVELLRSTFYAVHSFEREQTVSGLPQFVRLDDLVRHQIRRDQHILLR